MFFWVLCECVEALKCSLNSEIGFAPPVRLLPANKEVSGRAWRWRLCVCVWERVCVCVFLYVCINEQVTAEMSAKLGDISGKAQVTSEELLASVVLICRVVISLMRFYQLLRMCRIKPHWSTHRQTHNRTPTMSEERRFFWVKRVSSNNLSALQDVVCPLKAEETFFLLLYPKKKLSFQYLSDLCSFSRDVQVHLLPRGRFQAQNVTKLTFVKHNVLHIVTVYCFEHMYHSFLCWKESNLI